MPRSRVVITGLGVVSPIGTGTDAFWSALCQGESGVRRLSMYPRCCLPVTFGGEVLDFDARPFVRPKQRKSLKLMCRDIQMAVVAAASACQQAGIDEGTVDPDRLGVEFGAHTMHSEVADLAPAFRSSIVDGRFDFSRWGREGLGEIHPLWMLKYLPNMPACHIAIHFDARGPNNTITQNETSSLIAISEAVRVIERGWADVVIAGGTGSRVHPKSWASSMLYDQLSHREEPAEASRPFDADRDGLVNGEGAAAFVLESEAFAQARGARPLARILGYGLGCEPRRPWEPASGRGLEVAIAAALRDSGLAADDIGHVNADGLSTVGDDRAEARAIRNLLDDIPVTAPKSYFGNLGAGTGAVELAVSVLALQHGSVPATLNYHRPDPACPVNVIHGQPLSGAAPVALTLSQCSMGQTAALAVGRV